VKSYSQLTGKYLKEHKKRTALTLLGIILAIALFSALGTLYYSWKDAVIKDIKSRGNYEVIYNEISGDKVKSIVKNAEVLESGITESYGDGRIINGEARDSILSISNYDENALNSTFNISVKEGRFPQNNNEIIVETKFVEDLKEKLVGKEITVEMKTLNNNETSDNKEKKFIIVGIYDSKFSIKGNTYKAIGYFNKQINIQNKYNIYVNFKGGKNKISIGNKIAQDNSLDTSDNNNQISYNDALLRMYGESQNTELREDMKKLIFFICIIIVICTIAVIYNSFSISVVERSKHFGILRAIGATPKQIKSLVFKEAAIMGAIAIPLGVMAGYLGLYVIIKIIGNFSFDGLDSFKLGVYPKVLFICIGLGAITIFLSVRGPAKLASKVSPIDAIRNSKNIKKEKIKIRRMKVIKKLFGIEGELSYKNIRRNPKEFWVTIFSLVVSLVMFIVLINMINIIKQVDPLDISQSYYDSYINSGANKEGLSPILIEEIKKLDGVEEIYTPMTTRRYSALQGDKLSEKYFKQIGKNNDLEKIPNSEFVLVKHVGILSYDSNSMDKAKKHLLQGTVDEKLLDDNGVLLVQRKKIIKKGIETYEDFTKYKVGDKITLPVFKSMAGITYTNPKTAARDSVSQLIENDQVNTFTVIGILDREPITGAVDDQSISFIFSESMCKKVVDELYHDSVYIKFKSEKHRENLNGYFQDLCASDKNLSYFDLYKGKEEFYLALIFYYTFIAVIALVAIVNIINTININLLVKKREFGIYKAIGMTGKQFARLVILEGTLYGIITAVVGTIVGTIITLALIDGSNITIGVALNFNIPILICGIVGVILITFLASLLPLRKLNKVNIVESLRMEE
jgi:putative ABC transport system permease protein